MQKKELKPLLTKDHLNGKKNKVISDDKIDLSQMNVILNYTEFIKDEKNMIKFYDYINKRQYEILLESPLITIMSKYINITIQMIISIDGIYQKTLWDINYKL